MNRQALICLTCLALLPTAACGGTSTGNPANGEKDAGGGSAAPDASSEGTNTIGNNCDVKWTPLAALDSSTSLGFSAADVLALAKGKHDVSLQWLDVSPASYEPESGVGQLHVTITAPAPNPRFAHLTPPSGNGAGPAIEIGQPQCADRVALEVHVRVTSDGGALDESFDATLSAQTSRLASLEASEPASKVGGGLKVSNDVNKQALVLDTLLFQLSFTSFGVAGQLHAALSSPSAASDAGAGSAGVSTLFSIARWPAGADCEPQDVAVPAAATFGKLSAQAGEALVAATPVLTLRWQAGSSTPLSLAFTSSDKNACVGGADDPSGTQPLTMRVHGSLHATTADGRVAATWPVTLATVASAHDALDHVEIAFDATGAGDPFVDGSAFAQTYGIQGVDLTGYDKASAQLMLSFAADGGVAGMLSVNGAVVPACATEKPKPLDAGTQGSSIPGCAGYMLTPVEQATIKSP